ncbi:SCP2 sterol-binding domain-containing protein [Metabacillus malikii]|uniref:SCP2 domain-containing protein n=1 Tax=Metabacillus malikii TaxID=1504265 RepID=A0ABT9ZCM5_9BACI|nr:SCP2 sterol-binding domain-containing protein [Metabacillus malikii]MDQ0229684.1 hypothetical protein [Metabacillus malikii]
MYINTFIENVNNAKTLLATLLKKTLLVEIKPSHSASQLIELSTNGAKVISSSQSNRHFIMEGKTETIEAVLSNQISLKQSISFGEVTIKGSYRDFLKIDAIIKLS